MATVLVLTWEFAIPGCRSLKEKRMAVRSLRDRIRSRFHLSVAETDHQDVHDRAELTAAVVASDGRLADSVASKVDAFVAEEGRMVVLSFRSEQV
ncbi:MAG: DUF503 domain-containing protein [Gemmatimonadota bacterium]